MKKTPLREVKNFGPVTLPEFEAMGFRYLQQLEEVGFEAVCRKWVSYFPERLNANAFLGVIATLEGVVWVDATPAMRAKAKHLASQLRNEFGIRKRKKI